MAIRSLSQQMSKHTDCTEVGVKRVIPHLQKCPSVALKFGASGEDSMIRVSTDNDRAGDIDSWRSVVVQRAEGYFNESWEYASVPHRVVPRRGGCSCWRQFRRLSGGPGQAELTILAPDSSGHRGESGLMVSTCERYAGRGARSRPPHALRAAACFRGGLAAIGAR